MIYSFWLNALKFIIACNVIYIYSECRKTVCGSWFTFGVLNQRVRSWANKYRANRGCLFVFGQGVDGQMGVATQTSWERPTFGKIYPSIGKSEENAKRAGTLAKLRDPILGRAKEDRQFSRMKIIEKLQRGKNRVPEREQSHYPNEWRHTDVGTFEFIPFRKVWPWFLKINILFKWQNYIKKVLKMS